MAEYRYTGYSWDISGRDVSLLQTMLQIGLTAQGFNLTYLNIVYIGAENNGRKFGVSFGGVINANEQTALLGITNALNNVFSLNEQTGFNSFNSNTTQQPNTSNSGIIQVTVISGDTLTKIANRYRTTWQAIASLNNLTGNAVNLLRIGQQLLVNVGNSSTTRQPVTPVIDLPTVQNTINQNQNNTGQNIPVTKPPVTKSPFALDDFAQKLGVSVTVLALIGVVVLIVATKK